MGALLLTMQMRVALCSILTLHTLHLFALLLAPLLEENASDLCCLISSLVQVMMDPHCRTRVGFQSLVQKEWIMGGHCFLDRCNHLRQSDKEEVSVLIADLFSRGEKRPISYLIPVFRCRLLFAKCTLHSVGRL